MAKEEEPLLGLVRILKPLTSEERHRAVEAAMTYVGEKFLPARDYHGGVGGKDAAAKNGAAHHDGNYPKGVAAWMKQYDLASDEVDLMLQFHEDGTFAIHDVPGKNKKEQTLNVYILFGVCTYLTTNARHFGDAGARQICGDIGCLDKANHAHNLSGHGPEFSGDKDKGYTLSNVGIKKGAALVKEFAGGKK